MIKKNLKNLYIIAPCRKEDIWRKRRATFTLPPMALAILAALTPSQYRIKVTDELVDDIDFSYPADIVALSVNTTNAFRSYEVADIFRKRGTKVVLGGIHPSVMPDESLKHADSIVLGEAEGLWKLLLYDFLHQQLKERYYSRENPPLDSIPVPKWEFLNEKKYYVPRTFQVSRGCPYGCSFCSSTQFFGVKYRFRPVESIIEEIKAYKNKMVIFVDDNIVGNSDYSRELFQALKGFNKMWVAQSSIDIAEDESLLRLAAESGCAGLLIGFESIRYGNRSDVKKLRRSDDYAEAVKVIRRYGIGVHGSFVFGFDGDTADLFHSTVDFVLNNRLEVGNYCTLTPYPGTRLYEQMEGSGRLLHKNWSLYDRYNVVFEMKNFSVYEFKRLKDYAYKRTYSIPWILRRTPHVLRNIPYFYAINLSYWFGARERRKS